MNRTKFMETVSETYVFMMLLVFPIFICPDYSTITTVKMVLFLFNLAAFALSALVCSLIKPKTAEGEPASPPKMPARYVLEFLPDFFLGLFLCSGVISWLLSPLFGQTNADGLDLNWFGAGRFDGLLFLALYAVIYWLSSRYCNLKKNQLCGFAFIMFVMCAIAVVQLSGINLLNLYPASIYVGNPEEFFSTIGNADIMAGFMCMAVPLVSVGYVVYRLDKIMSAFFLLVNAVGIYVALSLGVDMSLVGLLGVFAIMIPLLLRNRRYATKLTEVLMSFVVGFGASCAVNYTYIGEEQRTVTHFDFGQSLWIALAVLAVLFGVWLMLKLCRLERLNWKVIRFCVAGAEVLAVVLVFCYFRLIYEHTGGEGLMKDLYELARGELSLTAGHNRIGIWTHAIEMAKRNLWFGTGCGTFAETFEAYAREVRYTRYMYRNLDFAHNEYVHYLCTMGLSGLLLYLGFLISAAWRAIKRINDNPKILVLGSAVLGYSIWVFFCFSIVIITPIFWLLFGMLMKEIRDTVKKKEMPPAEELVAEKAIATERSEETNDAPADLQEGCDGQVQTE